MDKMQLYSSFQLARMYSHKIDDLIDDGDFFADYITIKEISQCLGCPMVMRIHLRVDSVIFSIQYNGEFLN